ncbi:MAG: tetratricopeptide repeat protein [Hydrogenophaga sp.]|uniref:tetratricopeptide repeat protein n=1 Tax=Hydrogenophaga sp. TaxID=1904254 RepID=UPI0025BE3200|nr:tetratricopeptide repeat protein [Hydrogenophaga sp.]MBT9549771.1 tetratricopeptide repeat protein [Hydrogenophaga sp.]
MSLIYQALQQTAEQATSRPSAEKPPLSSPQTAPEAVGGRGRHMVLVGAAMAGVGVLGGFFISQWGGAEARPAPASVGAAALPAKPSAVDTLYGAEQATPVQNSLPRMEAPLPTALPSLTLTYALPVAVQAPAPAKAAVQPVTPAPAGSADAAPVSMPAPAPALKEPPATAVPARPAAAPVAPAASAAPDDLSERFEGMNHALDNKDDATARRHLQAIQAQLPATSVARLRAEAWFAYQSGDLSSAQRTYRRLLDRLPGDEQAALTLASIEKKSARPDQARDILSRSLRVNPGSVPLRSAMDQLAASEAPK